MARGQAALAAKISPRELEKMIGAVWKLQRAQSLVKRYAQRALDNIPI